MSRQRITAPPPPAPSGAHKRTRGARARILLPSIAIISVIVLLALVFVDLSRRMVISAMNRSGVERRYAATEQEVKEQRQHIRTMTSKDGAISAGRGMGMVETDENAVILTYKPGQQPVATPKPAAHYNLASILPIASLLLLLALAIPLLIARARRKARKSGTLTPRLELRRQAPAK